MKIFIIQSQLNSSKMECLAGSGVVCTNMSSGGDNVRVVSLLEEQVSHDSLKFKSSPFLGQSRAQP